MDSIIWSRQFAMPNHETFSLPPVARLLDHYVTNWKESPSWTVADPFARNSKRGTLTNDLNPATEAQAHMLAEDWVLTLAPESLDVALFDPPYSPRQVSEMYQSIGLKCATKDTQNGHMARLVKDGLHRALRPSGIAICCGWNSMGFGLTRGYELIELLLVTHGGVHNDTIVTVERKVTA